MLTHHQLFTRSADAMHSDLFGESNVNPYLYEYFSGYFADKIAAWFWGHEHSFALFKNGLLGLNMGRLLGSSSYEEAISDNPYASTFPLVTYNANNVQVAPNSYSTSHNANQYYPHVGAILQLHGASEPTIDYYSFPSWDLDYNEPTGMALTNLVSESITNPTALPTGVWNKNKSISYNTDNGPGMAFVGTTVFLVFQNKDDSSRIYWDNPSYASGTLHKNLPTLLTPHSWASYTDSDYPSTDKNPALVNYNGTLVMVYKDKNSTDLCWCTCDSNNQQWTKYGRLEDFISSSPNIQSNHSPSLAVFNNKVYLVYLSATDDKTVYWCHYDGSQWYSHGSKNLKLPTGSTASTLFQSGHGVCPALAANADNLFLVFNDGNHLAWIKGDKSDNWSYQSVVTNNNVTTNAPTSTVGAALTADGTYLNLYYIGSDNNIYWATYNLSDKTWSGGIPTMTGGGSLPQSACTPAACKGPIYSILLYRGNSNNKLYYSSKSNNA